MDINKMVDTLEQQGSFVTDKRIYKNILFYYGAILLNKYNFRKHGGKNINYFGITLAMSASGKDFARDLVSSVMQLDDNGKYPQLMKAVAKESGADCQMGIPQNTTVSVEGTKEGLFKVAQGQAASGFGSLNLLANEMGSIITSSHELIEKTKELYDGFYRAKVTKGDKEDTPETNIENIITNFFMFGSPSGVDSEAKENLIKLSHSGLYRRSFILNIEPKKTTYNENKLPIEPLVEYFDALIENHGAIYKGLKNECNHYLFNQHITISDDAIEALEGVKKKLFDLANSNVYDELTSAEKGSYTMIENLAHIVAFLEFRTEVEPSDLSVAYDWFQETRSSIRDSLLHKRPYKSMFDLLMRGRPLALTEMAEIDKEIPTSQSKIKDEILLLKEICYRKNLRLNTVGGNITRYSIEKLPVNNLKKIILGLNKDNLGPEQKHQSINFLPAEIPFFGEGTSVETAVRSEKLMSFTTCHFEPSPKAPDGHRKADNFITGQNLIAFDIDEVLTIKEAQELLSDYTYIIYETKSHQIDKDGTGARDRFRILLPTSSEFFVDSEQHKKLYENLSVRLGIDVFDTATRNVSRLWCVNPKGNIYKNEGELLDISCCMPSTEKSEKAMPMISSVNEYIDDNKLDKRIEGIYRWVYGNISLGRNNVLFRAGKMIKELNQDHEYHIRTLYGMMEPFETKNEIEVIISSVGR